MGCSLSGGGAGQRLRPVTAVDVGDRRALMLGHVQGTAGEDNVVRTWRGHQHRYGARLAYPVVVLILREALVRSTSLG